MMPSEDFYRSASRGMIECGTLPPSARARLGGRNMEPLLYRTAGAALIAAIVLWPVVQWVLR
jgi:hypothetical protein